MPKQMLMCEICREVIGIFYTEDVEEPIRAGMFHSKDASHGFPPPFRSPALEWEHMRCPYCQKRPFLSRGIVMTTEGFWSTKEKKLVDRPDPQPEISRDETEKLLHERYVREEMDRHDTDASRLESDIDDRLGTVRTVTVPPEEEAPPTEEIPLHYGPDARVDSEGKVEPGPKYEDLTPEEKRAEAERRIALDEEAEEKPKHKHPCPFCELGYAHLGSLNRHVRDKHGGSDANRRSTSTDNNTEAGSAQGVAAT